MLDPLAAYGVGTTLQFIFNDGMGCHLVDAKHPNVRPKGCDREVREFQSLQKCGRLAESRPSLVPPLGIFELETGIPILKTLSSTEVLGVLRISIDLRRSGT